MPRSDVYFRIQQGVHYLYINPESEEDYEAHTQLTRTFYPQTYRVQASLELPLDHHDFSKPHDLLSCLTPEEIRVVGVGQIFTSDYTILTESSPEEVHVLKSRKPHRQAEKTFDELVEIEDMYAAGDRLKGLLEGPGRKRKQPLKQKVRPFVSFRYFGGNFDANQESDFHLLGPLCPDSPEFLAKYLSTPAIESYGAQADLFGLKGPAAFCLSENIHSKDDPAPIYSRVEPLYTILVPVGDGFFGEAGGVFNKGETLGSRLSNLQERGEKTYNFPDYTRFVG